MCTSFHLRYLKCNHTKVSHRCSQRNLATSSATHTQSPPPPPTNPQSQPQPQLQSYGHVQHQQQAQHRHQAQYYNQAQYHNSAHNNSNERDNQRDTPHSQTSSSQFGMIEDQHSDAHKDMVMATLLREEIARLNNEQTQPPQPQALYPYDPILSAPGFNLQNQPITITTPTAPGPYRIQCTPENSYPIYWSMNDRCMDCKLALGIAPGPATRMDQWADMDKGAYQKLKRDLEIGPDKEMERKRKK